MPSNHDAERDPHAAPGATAGDARPWAAAFEAAGHGAWDWDAVTGHVSYSPRWKAMLGYAPGDIGDTLDEWKSRVHPDDLPTVLEAITRHEEGRTTEYVSEHRVRCKDGTWLWVLDRGLIVERSADGRPVRWVGTHTDVTERRRHEAEIERLGRLYAALSHVNQAIVRSTTEDALFRHVCRALVEYAGFKAVRIGRVDHATLQVEVVATLGDTAGYVDRLQVSASPDVPEGRGPTGTAIREDRAYVCNDITADPATLPWRDAAARAGCRGAAAFPVRMGGRQWGSLTVYAGEVGFFGPREVALLEETAFDVGFGLATLELQAERRRAEQAVRETALRLQTSVAAANVGLWDWHLTSDRVWFSPEWKRQIGYEDQEIAHEFDEWRRRVHPDDIGRVMRYVEDFVRQGPRVFQQEFRLRHKNGSYRHILAQGTLIKDEDGRPLRIMGSHIDTTDRVEAELARQQLEAQLLHAQRLESLGRLAGGVAHDFNNMLAVIRGYAEMGAEDVPHDSPAAHSFREILSAAERSAALTRQLLAFARQQSARPVVLDLNQTVGGLLNMLSRLIGEHIELQWKPGQGLWPVRVDPTQVDQLLANLAVNARDAIGGAGGAITIALSNVATDASWAGRHPGCKAGAYVRLDVHDTGSGIPPDVQARMFEPFFTTKTQAEGTGLGLATVYGIVQQNGGAIEVESTVGAGATFRIFLPRADAVAAAADAAAQAPAARGHETVLLVEDEPAILRLGASMLQRLGYHVIAAGSPDEALERASAFPGVIHLLVTDVIMPKLNGRQLAARLVASRDGLRCLYMSGYTGDIIDTAGVLEPGVHFLQKPYSLASLGAAIRSALDR
jgi:PAS domain S-box-containing protein